MNPKMSIPSTTVLDGTRVALLCAVLLLAVGCAEGDRTPDATAVDPVRAALVAESAALAPGDTVQLGLHFRIAEGWHLYWKGRSDTGAPIAVTALLPPGYVAGPLLWPAPERHLSPGRILDHIYRDELLLILPVVVPAAALLGSEARFAADLEWVVCREECRVGRAHVELTLPVVARPRAGAAPAFAARAPLFVRFRRRMPVPWPHDRTGLTATWQGDVLLVSDERGGDLVFYPEMDCGRLVDPLTDGVGGGGRLQLRFDSRDGIPGPARGVLEIRPSGAGEPVWYKLDIPHPETGTAG
jgi:hypothetical protein